MSVLIKDMEMPKSCKNCDLLQDYDGDMYCPLNNYLNFGDIENVPDYVMIGCPLSAQPEQSTAVQDILQYLDEYLHPIVSPEHLSVYSELHDMVSMLLLAQPDRKRGKWVQVHGFCTPGGDPVWACSECGKGIHVYGIEHGTYGADVSDGQWKACPNCGAVMEGEQ